MTRTRFRAALAAACLFAAAGPADAGFKAALLHSDDSSFAADAAAQLLATGQFDAVDLFDVSFGLPSLATLGAYDGALAWTDFVPPDAVGFGDLLADFADTNKRVVVATYGFSNPWAIAGRITTSGYSPLMNDGVNQDVSGNLAAVAASPIFTGVDLAAVTYFHNGNFANPGLDLGATLLADDGAGVNMIAISGDTRVVGINLFPGGGFLGNNAEFYGLLANTLTQGLAPTAVPAPAGLALVACAVPAVALRRLARRKVTA